MQKLFTLIFMLIPLALYSQTEDSLSHYKAKEIKTMSTFEELLYPGNEFFSIGLLPFNYYHFSDEMSSGEDLAGYLGLNLGYYYAHSRKVFMSLSMGYSGMTDNTMFFGDNFDNINLTSVFEGNNYKGIPYTFEKEFEDIRFSFMENMAFDNLIVSLGVGVNITKYRFFYKYQGKAEEGTETKFGLRTKKTRYTMLSSIIGLQYCVLNSLALEMQMRYSAHEFSNRGIKRDNLFSINFGISYKIPLQSRGIKYKDGKYQEAW